MKDKNNDKKKGSGVVQNVNLVHNMRWDTSHCSEVRKKKVSCGWEIKGGNVIGPLPSNSGSSSPQSWILTSDKRPTKVKLYKEISSLELGSRVLTYQEEEEDDNFGQLTVVVVLDFVNSNHIWVRDKGQIREVGLNSIFQISHQYMDLPKSKVDQGQLHQSNTREIHKYCCMQLSMLKYTSAIL